MQVARSWLQRNMLMRKKIVKEKDEKPTEFEDQVAQVCYSLY